MYLKQERVEKICNDLKKLILIQNVELSNWKVKQGFFVNPQEAEASNIPWKNFDNKNDLWIGHDDYFWFSKEFEVPPSFDGKDLYFFALTQKTYWDAVNPQFLVFLNGKVLQGMDVNHTDVLILSGAKAGQKIKLDIQAYTGRDTDIHEGSNKKLTFTTSLIEYDYKIKDLYYNLLVPNKIVKWLGKDNYNAIQLQNAVEKAINLVDFRVPYSKDFHNSIDVANEFIEQEVYTKLAGNDEVIATCIGHTHIDIAWWWTVEQTRQKVARSFSTVLKYMEEYPNYKFMSSQPQLYKFVKQRYPELMDKIKEKISNGEWEAEGGMWLESDCNVVSGESLVRQFLHGKTFFKDEFGVDSKILWLPDVFGYSAALPQILKKCGIDYFMTTKISWNQYNKLPVDTFWWKGIDGTSVFTHLITTQDDHQSKDSFFTTYNGNLNPISVIRSWERYQQKDINNDVLISFGYGDGGGGPTRDMLEVSKRMQKGLIGAPKVRVETSKKYFDELYQKVADNPRLPTWAGELYLEFHRGTYTSMARNKRSNRKCEILLQDLEFFSVWAENFKDIYPKEYLYDSWELLLLNQFHDILPGSSIKDVYDVTKVEYDKLEQDSINLINKKLNVIANNLTSDSESIVIFNSLSFDRTDTVTLDCNYNGLITNDNTELPTQKTFDGKLLALVTNLPQRGCGIFKKANNTYKSKNPFKITAHSIETDSYIIEFNKNAQFTRMFDKIANREILLSDKVGNNINIYEDKPINYDNWDIEIYYKEKYWNLNDTVKCEWVEMGPIRATLLVEHNFCESKVIQKIYFYNHTNRIDFDTFVDWKQNQLLMRVDFPVDINTGDATYDIQFGSLKRNTHNNTSWDKAQFEVCAHKWADLSDNNYGVSILNDSKYGHLIKENVISLTLLKSGVLPNPVTDQEEHKFIYSIYPHQNSWENSNTISEAYMINIPLYYSITQDCKQKSDIKSLINIDAQNVVIETVKNSEDDKGIIIRMYESQNKTTNANISFNIPTMSNVYECDLMENNIRELSYNNEVNFTIKPYEIKTFKILK